MEIIHTKMVIWMVSYFFFYCLLINFTILWIFTLISLMIALIIYWFFYLFIDTCVCECLKANCDFSTTLNFVLICKILRRFFIISWNFWVNPQEMEFHGIQVHRKSIDLKVREFYDFYNMHALYVYKVIKSSKMNTTRIKISLL